MYSSHSLDNPAETFTTVQALGAGPECGSWWLRPDAVTIAETVDAVLASLPPHRTGRIVDVLHLADKSMQRLVESCGTADAAGAPQLLAWTQTGGSESGGDAVLLKHTYSWPTGAEVLVRTLVARSGVDVSLVRDQLWGAYAKAALTTERVAVLLSVAGRTLDAAANAELPTAQRLLLKKIRKAQVLASLRGCVACRFARGVVLMRDVVASFTDGDIRDAASTLALFLQIGEGSRPTFHSCKLKTRRGEALEAEGRYAEAAVLYKECIADDMRFPGCIQSPPLYFQYLGIALRKSGDEAAALRAYNRGLAIVQTCHVEPDTPEWRESLRLGLLELKANIARKHQNRADFCAIAVEMFHNLPNAASLHYCVTDDGIWAEEAQSGRRWGVVHGRNFTEEDLQLCCIEELPPRVGRFSVDPTPPAAGAHTLLSRSALKGPELVEAPLPKLASKCCVCGRIADKMQVCSVCKDARYCNAACQTSAWPEHKKVCKRRGSGRKGG